MGISVVVMRAVLLLGCSGASPRPSVFPTYEQLEEQNWLAGSNGSICTGPEMCEGMCLTDPGACQEGQEAISVMLWVMVEGEHALLADTMYSSLLDMHLRSGVPCHGWHLYIDAQWSLVSGSYYCGTHLGSNENLQLRRWVHVALTMTPPRSTFYVDGVQAATWATHAYLGDCSGACPVVYGARRYSFAFAGRTKQLRIFKGHELSAAEIIGWKGISDLAFYHEEELPCTDSCELNAEGSTSDLPGAGPFTIMLDVRMEESGQRGLMGWGDEAGEYVALRMFGDQISFSRGVAGQNGRRVDEVRGGRGMLDGTWHSVAVTWDVLNYTATLYVDGTWAAGGAWGTPFPDMDKSSFCVCAAGLGVWNGTFSGIVRGIRIYNRRLWPDEIADPPAVWELNTVTETSTTASSTTSATDTSTTTTETATTTTTHSSTITMTTETAASTTIEEPCSAGSYWEGGECQPCPLGYHSLEGSEGPESCKMLLGTALANISPPFFNVRQDRKEGSVVITVHVEELPQVHSGALSYSVDLVAEKSRLTAESNCSKMWTQPTNNTFRLIVTSRDGPCTFKITETDTEATWSTFIGLFVVTDDGFVAPPIIQPLTLRLRLLHEAWIGGAAWGLQSITLEEMVEDLDSKSALAIFRNTSYATPFEHPVFVAGDVIPAVLYLTSSALDYYELSFLRAFLSTSADPDDWRAVQHNLTGEVVVTYGGIAGQLRFHFIARPCHYCWLHCISRLTSRRLEAVEMVPLMPSRLLSPAAVEDHVSAWLSITAILTKHVTFDGDYDEVVGENKTAFLTECSKELDPIKCIDVTPGRIAVTSGVSPRQGSRGVLDKVDEVDPGSIMVTFGLDLSEGSQEDLERVAEAGLHLRGFPALDVQAETPDEPNATAGMLTLSGSASRLADERSALAGLIATTLGLVGAGAAGFAT